MVSEELLGDGAVLVATQTKDSDRHGERDRGLLGPQRLLAACSVPTRYCTSYTVAAAPHAPHDAVAEVLTWWLWRMVCPQTMGVLLVQWERTLLGQAVPHSLARGVTWDVCLPP